MFGVYDSFESGDQGFDWHSGVGWCGGAGVVEVVYNVRMGVGIGDVGNRIGVVVSSRENVSVTDSGADGGGARWRDCCRFPDGIFRELQEDLPYRLSFTLHICNVFL